MACEVTWLQRGNPEIARLSALATEQQKVLSLTYPNAGPAKATRSNLPIFPFDTMITPWESKFGNDPDWHFVAQAPDGRICGWLTAQLKETDSRRYIYLAEISTRRIRDELYGGVGKKLHDALVAAASGYDFIYLYPVNERVAAVYEKWGYTRSYQKPGIAHQFYVINRGPTEGILRSLILPAQDAALMNRARGMFGKAVDPYRRAILATQENKGALDNLLVEFEQENADAELLDDGPSSEDLANIARTEAARLKEQRTRMLELLHSMPKPKGGGKTARNTHRLRFFRKHHLPVHGYSLGELSKVSKVSQPILRQVYDRGIGAYKTNPTSVRMKGTFRKGVKAPYSKKLSKEQWAMARVYSFLDGNPKHDTDLRRKTRRRHK